MKLSVVLSSIVGATLSFAQVTVVTTALYNISNQTSDLNDAISKFSIADLTSLQLATAKAIGAISDGNTQSSEIQNLTVNDALLLTPILTDLTMVVNKTVANTIDHKDAFGGLAPVVLANLQQQQQLTIAFSGTISEKLPENLRAIAAQQNVPIFNALASGIAVFQNTTVNTNKAIYSSDAAVLGLGWGALMLAGSAWYIGTFLL